MAIKKKHILNINMEGKSSRFLVDLATSLREEEHRRIKAIEDSFEYKFNKFLLALTGYIQTRRDRIRFIVSNFFKGLKSFFSFKKFRPKRIFSRDKKTFNGDVFLNGVKYFFNGYHHSFFSSERYKKLSFYFLFHLFFKINYFTGWLFIALIKFMILAPVFVFRKAGDHFLASVSDFSVKLADSKSEKKSAKIEADFRKKLAAEIYKKVVEKEKSHVAVSQAKAVKREKIFTFKKISGFASRLVPRFRLSFIKQAAIFSFLLLVLIVPLKIFFHYQDFQIFKGRVLGVSISAVDDLKNSSGDISELNFDKATQNFTNAANNFKIAQDEIRELNVIFDALATVVPSRDVKLAAQADLFLRAGELTASIADRIGGSLDLFNTKDLKIKDVLNILYENLNSSNAEIVELGEILKKIDLENLPDEYREKVSLFQKSSADISGLFNELTRLVDGTRKIFGFDHDRRYLVIFQNNTEMRGSGGFVGSYALADFRNGEMVNLEVPTGGSYDTEAGYLARVAAPDPLQLVNPLWHFWDANWWPDWAMSAKKLMWFYEKSNGPTVDGVIALTPNVMADLLKVIGPLDMREKYGVEITSENFWSVVQDIVEKKPEVLPNQATTTLVKVVEEKQEPKKIIGDMMDLIMVKISKEMNREAFVGILKVAYKSLNEKHILAYFVDEELEKLTKDFDWGGLMENVDGDYLMVANSNIAGAKSDKKIKESISLLREVQADGSIVNTLKIQRLHTGIRGDDHVGVRNVDWMRVYVPAGSELIEASGFSAPDGKFFEKPAENWQIDEDVLRGEGNFIVDNQSETKIYQELGKTVFANWSMVDPGEQVLITIKYKLPFVIKKDEITEPKSFIDKIINQEEFDSYAPLKLLVQKQPGSQGSDFVSNLILPGNMQVAWQNYNSLNYENKLNVDRNWVLLLKIE